MADIETDLLIIGAGPSGLYATYYAGFRGLRVALVDSLPELGGQVTAMYPEKLIFDVAGFPSIKGRDLVAGLLLHDFVTINKSSKARWADITSRAKRALAKAET